LAVTEGNWMYRVNVSGFRPKYPLPWPNSTSHALRPLQMPNSTCRSDILAYLKVLWHFRLPHWSTRTVTFVPSLIWRADVEVFFITRTQLTQCKNSTGSTGFFETGSGLRPTIGYRL
jgi:hypothetical protein